MSATKIEWTDATWNPTTGCTRVSPGCKNCYAFALHDMRHAAHQAGRPVPLQYAQPFKEVQLLPQRLTEPLHWLIRQGGPARKTDVARALGIDWGRYYVVLDHWWFRHENGRVWLSEDGVRELAGTVRRAYDATDVEVTA